MAATRAQKRRLLDPTQQGDHSVWWKMHHLHPRCLPSCLSVHAVFWHDASSVGSWETWNILTSLCQAPPASQDEALWWLRWQWQTDNEWMLHFTPLTSFWNGIFFFLPPPNCPSSRRATEDKGWLREITFSPPRTFYMETHGSSWWTRHQSFRGFSAAWVSTRHFWAHYPYLTTTVIKKENKCSEVKISNKCFLRVLVIERST